MDILIRENVFIFVLRGTSSLLFKVTRAERVCAGTPSDSHIHANARKYPDRGVGVQRGLKNIFFNCIFFSLYFFNIILSQKLVKSVAVLWYDTYLKY